MATVFSHGQRPLSTLRPPSDDDLQEAAAANFFELSQDELADFQALLRSIFPSIDQLVNTPIAVPPLKYRDRDPGSRPSPADNLLNAVIRRCSVKGATSGKLAGKRVGVKDCIAVAGVPMTLGSIVMDGYIPERDATIVTKLLDAGAEIVATLNMDSFAFSAGALTSAFGPCFNPHSAQHLAGGSSGGSAAALYYDDIDLTIGCDQGGSIRIPASWCGVVGLKPTHGLVPYTGIVGIDATIDHAGPLARTVADCALTLEVIAGKDPLDPRQAEAPVQTYTEALGRDISGLKIGVLREGFGTPVSEPDVDDAVREAVGVLAGLGAELREASVPAHVETGAISWALFAEGMAANLQSNGVGYHLRGAHDAELASALGKFRRVQANDLPPTLKLSLALGTYLRERYHGSVYAKAQNLRFPLRAEYDRAFQEVDVLAMPTTPMKAHRHEPALGRAEIMARGWNMLGNTTPFNLTGHPALNIPCANSNGLPIGLMLVGRHFEEAALFQVAYAYEQAVNWEEA